MSFSPIQLKEFAGGPVVFDGLASGGSASAVATLSGYTQLAIGPILFDTAAFDPHGFFSAPDNGFVVPAGMGGTYLCGIVVTATSAGATTITGLLCSIETSGAALNIVADTTPSAALSTTAYIANSGIIALADGDVLTGDVYGWSGTTPSLNIANPSQLWLLKLA